MNHRTAFTAMLFILLVVAATLSFYFVSGVRPTTTSGSSTYTSSTMTSLPQDRVNLLFAAYYLASDYNSKAQLVSETANSRVFYLYSDKYLIVQALRNLHLTDPMLVSLMDNISETIDSYSKILDGAMNQYMVLDSNWNDPCVFNNVTTYHVATVGGANILADINNGKGQLSESKYADIAFLSAICYKNEGNLTQAIREFNVGKAMFNGTGLVDAAFTDPTSPSYHVLQTYKLGLYLLVSKDLSQPIDQRALDILLRMQSPLDGGFYTGYDASLTPIGAGSPSAENAETTSLAMLGLTGLYLR